MAPAGNWMSFSLPHTEVLLRSCSQYEAHNAVSLPFHAPYTTQVDAGSYYEYCFFPQAPKLEDLLGGYPSLALEPCSEAQDSSSLSTAHHAPPPPPPPPPPPSQALAAPRANSARSEVHDSVSATGNNKQYTREKFAVQRLAGEASTPAAGEPLAAEKLAASALAVSGASSQRTSAFRGVTSGDVFVARASGLAGTDGRGVTRRTYGTTHAAGRDRSARGGKIGGIFEHAYGSFFGECYGASYALALRCRRWGSDETTRGPL